MGEGTLLSGAIRWVNDVNSYFFGNGSLIGIDTALFAFLVYYISKIIKEANNNIFDNIFAYSAFSILISKFIFDVTKYFNDKYTVIFVFYVIIFVLYSKILYRLLKFSIETLYFFPDKLRNVLSIWKKERSLYSRYKNRSRNVDLSEVPNSHRLLIDGQVDRKRQQPQDSLRSPENRSR